MSRLAIAGDSRSNPHAAAGAGQNICSRGRRPWHPFQLSAKFIVRPAGSGSSATAILPASTVRRWRSRRSSSDGARTQRATCFAGVRGARSAATRERPCSAQDGWGMVLPTGNRSRSVSCYEGRELGSASPLMGAELPSWPSRGDANGRVEMWRGGGRPNISVVRLFRLAVLSGSAMTPFPHPAHRTGQADLPHPALGQDFTPLLSRATPSAVSEPLRS
jgi:hypothetical protein